MKAFLSQSRFIGHGILRYLPLPLFLLIGWLLAGGLVRTVVPIHTQRAETVDAITLYERQAMVSVMGEFRSSLASYLWMKTDEYTHGGVRLRPMTMREKRTQTVHRASSADRLHEHTDETGVIPEPERDPRWLWGDLERHIKPYFDVRHHFHRPVHEVLPLYRLMTWADPTFVQGYLVGAQMILFDNKQNLSEALRFLQEGARNNPHSIAIFTELGRYALIYQKDPQLAERYLLKSIENGKDWTPQNPYEREGLLHAYRWLALKAYREGNRSQMHQWAQRGLERFPNDPPLQMLLNR
ncbi:MAG: hypothetical protein C4337_03960 [Armatimonadota bacterium]